MSLNSKIFAPRSAFLLLAALLFIVSATGQTAPPPSQQTQLAAIAQPGGD